jgi:hypothetical protein
VVEAVLHQDQTGLHVLDATCCTKRSGCQRCVLGPLSYLGVWTCR